MKDAKAITMKNGKPAMQGLCPTCGTKMFRIGKSSNQSPRNWAAAEGAGCMFRTPNPFLVPNHTFQSIAWFPYP